MIYNIKKLIDSLTIFAKNNQELTKLRINKLLYFVDKAHLINYGRLVYNDLYVSLRCGPVAEKSNNILNDFIDCELFSIIDSKNKSENYLGKYFELSFTSKGYEKLEMKNESDLSSLSKSEIEIIKKVLGEYGKIPTSKLVDISHREPAWLQTPQTEIIDFRLLLEGFPPEKKELISELITIDRENELFLTKVFNS